MKIDKESLQKRYSEMKIEDLFVLLWKSEELSELAIEVVKEELISRSITGEKQSEIVKILAIYKLRAQKKWPTIFVNHTIAERMPRVFTPCPKYFEEYSKKRLLAGPIEAGIRLIFNKEVKRLEKEDTYTKFIPSIGDKNSLVNRLNEDLDLINDKLWEFYVNSEDDESIKSNIEKIDRIFLGLCKQYDSWQSFALALEVTTSRLEQQSKSINKYHPKIQPLIKKGLNILSKTINGELTMSDKVLNQLLTESADWYGNFVKNNARVPTSISGVSADGKRFVFLLDVLGDMKFDHVQQHKFIKVVLEQEKVEAYIYGTLVMAFSDDPTDAEEMLDLVAANSRRYVCGSWRVIRSTDGRAKEIQQVSTYEGQDSEEYPGAWFLTSALGVSSVERGEYEDLWSQLRKNAQFNFAPIYPVKSEKSPREILAADFPSLGGGLPIRGGWGYAQADARCAPPI